MTWEITWTVYLQRKTEELLHCVRGYVFCHLLGPFFDFSTAPESPGFAW